MNREKILTNLAEIREFRAKALENWAREGFDACCGLFREGLAFDGTIDAEVESHPHRFRVQARQIYVYAQNWLETRNVEFLQRAVLCAETVIKHFRNDAHGFIYSIQSDYTPCNAQCFAYEQAFAIFAFVHLGHVSGDTVYFNIAKETWDFIERHLARDADGFHKQFPPKNTDAFEQNHHMHLLEAVLYAYVFTGDPQWCTRAEKLFECFKKYFYNAENHTINEIITPAETHPNEPGHAAEWVWLLHIYSLLSGVDTTSWMSALYAQIERDIPPESCFVFEQHNAQHNVIKDTRRLWCQTELLKAHVAMYQVFQNEVYAERASTLLDQLFTHYFLKNTGTWHESLTPNGEDTYIYAPASSFYHICMAFQETFRVFEGILAQKCSACKGCNGGCHAHHES